MKNTWKKLLLAPLLLALAVTPLRADDDTADKTNTTVAAPTSPAAPEQPDAPEPPEHHHSPHPVVGIDPSGIYLGGTNQLSLQLPNSQGMSEEKIGAAIVFITLISVFIPFFFITLIIAALLFFRYRRNRMLHETLRAMIEKGAPIPPELLTPQGARVRLRMGSDLRSGLVMLGLGAGLVFISHGRWGGTGLIVLFIGVAFLITWFVERREDSKNAAK